MGKTDQDPDDDHLEESRKLLDQMDALLQRVRNLVPPPRRPNDMQKPALVKPKRDADKK